MSASPFAWDWMAAVIGPAGTRGCSLPEGQTFHDTAIATNSAVTWPPGTSIGRVRITKSILRDRDPCALSDLIAETVRRNPEITAFLVRPSGADYSSLLESLSTRLPRDHARIHNHYMAAHPVDAEPPDTLRFASTKPKPATFAIGGWHKEAAKRKSGEETLPIYSLSSRSAWEWDGDGPGLTVPSAYAASGLLALPVTSTLLFVAHEDPLLELPSDCPTAVNSDPGQLAGLQHLFIRIFFAEYEVEESHKQALAIAEERWARIFNHNRPVAGRAHDPPDRKMVWGKPEDMAKHPDGEEHIRLWDLPRLSAMVTRVKAKLEAILGKTLHVMTQGYVESITHVRQLPHRDFPAASLPMDGIALSMFWALSMDIPDDEVCAQWWALEGPDDTHCLRAIDTKANFNQDVLDVLSTVDVWHLGNRIPSVCALTGDGKAMLSANYHKGKCWVGCHCIDSLARANSVPAQCRWGSFLRAIGPCNRVGNVEHGSRRIANAIVKRVNETLKDLIENGKPDVSRAARDAGKALVLELHKLLDEVKNVPHAERLAPRPTKAGIFDITAGKMFFEDSALRGRVVAVLRDNLPDVAFGGVKFFLLMKHVLLSMHRMHMLWRKRDWLTQAELKELESASDRLGECWGKLQWGVTPPVHRACVHSAYFARRFGSLSIFRSIPIEYRNQPFKRHLKNSMRGWCLR